MILFVGKNKPVVDSAAKALPQDSYKIISDSISDDEINEALMLQPDYLISFLSPYIFNAQQLKAVKYAINFHPGLPKYPGIGCYSWAIYEGAREYGCTIHTMEPEVDAGKILYVSSFTIDEHISVAWLIEKTYAYMLVLFYNFITDLDLYPKSRATYVYKHNEWGKKHTRKELDNLMRIEPGMAADEIERRIRATSYKGWKPYIMLGGYRFKLNLEG